MDADVASELRYRDPPLAEGGGAILVSQSGETADTLAAMQLLRAGGQRVLSVVNVPESSMARESDGALLTVAGPEIGVASTKAFTAQLAVLACLAVGFGRARRELTTLGRGAADPGAAGGAGQRRRHPGAGRARSGSWRPRSPRPATCCSSAAGRSSRSRWKAR